MLDAQGNTVLALTLLAFLLVRPNARIMLRRFAVHLGAVIFFIFLLNSLIYPESGSSLMGSVGFLRKDGIQFAWHISARLLVLIFSQIFFFTSADPHLLAEWAMRRDFGQSLGYVFLFAISLLQLLRHKLEAVTQAQQSRGLKVEGNVFVRTRAFLPIIAPLVFSYLKESINRSIGLSLKGFGSKSSYTPLAVEEPQPLHEKFIAMLVISGFLFSLALKVLR
ncbi:energy-coupling factor transporter transmembrane protein EcfT [Acidobacteria bacterium AH-259-G07]|nr:energy-coupling factor transporter transmembrane protein EcfT [Acidobacteria bacterium AH-259-G07]